MVIEMLLTAACLIMAVACKSGRVEKFNRRWRPFRIPDYCGGRFVAYEYDADMKNFTAAWFFCGAFTGVAIATGFRVLAALGE